LPAGRDVLHPVEAEHVDGDLYRLVGPLPLDRVWEFATGDLVQCRLKMLAPNQACLVAYARVDDGA
jgi:hypothetical protein